MWDLVMEKADGGRYIVVYDPIANEFYRDGEVLRSEVPLTEHSYNSVPGKVSVRITMGKRCNFKCAYCSQLESKKTAKEGGKYSPEELAEQLIKFCKSTIGDINHIQLWGGETLLYLDTIKRFHAYFMEHLPEPPVFFISTNGSLFKGERFEWLRDNNFFISFSYDGPGQSYRGNNVLDDPEVVQNVCWYLDNNPTKFQFAPVMTKLSWSHRALADDIKRKIGRDDFRLTEAVPAFVESEQAMNCAIDIDHLPDYGRRLYQDMITGKLPFYGHFVWLTRIFLSNLGKPAAIDNTRCFVNKNEVLTVDMSGNIQVCQNLNAEDAHDSGEPYCYGNIFTDTKFPKSELRSLKERRATRCKECLVVNICKGGCPYMGEKYKEYNCATNFWHCMAILGTSVSLLTGDTLCFWKEHE